MPESVVVEVARYTDRDVLMEVLRGYGYDAREIEENGQIGIEIPCDGNARRLCDELIGELESLVTELGVPLVPELGDHVVFLRPPAD